MATNASGTATVGVIEGQEYDAVITLSLPDAVTTAPPVSYTADIDWGDGTPNSTAVATPVYAYSSGTLSGSLILTATHVYAAAGTYTVSGSATNPDTGNSSSASQSLTGAALLNAIPQTIAAVSGSSTGTVTVGEFEDDNTSATTSAFTTVSINWGDGSARAPAPSFPRARRACSWCTAPTPIARRARMISACRSLTAAGQHRPSTARRRSDRLDRPDAGTPTADPSRADLITLGNEQVDLNQGAVIVSALLDFDQSPDSSVSGSPALVYNSATTSPKPVIQFELQSDPNTGNPAATQYQVAWSFNGVAQTTKTFSVSSFQAGAVDLFSVQVGSAVTATGVYPWSATVTVTLSGGGTVTLTPSGYIPVVVRDASPYGAGWGIGSSLSPVLGGEGGGEGVGSGQGVDQLYPITASGTVPAGMLWVTGSGEYRFFRAPDPTPAPRISGPWCKAGAIRFTQTRSRTFETFELLRPRNQLRHRRRLGHELLVHQRQAHRRHRLRRRQHDHQLRQPRHPLQHQRARQPHGHAIADRHACRQRLRRRSQHDHRRGQHHAQLPSITAATR